LYARCPVRVHELAGAASVSHFTPLSANSYAICYHNKLETILLGRGAHRLKLSYYYVETYIFLVLAVYSKAAGKGSAYAWIPFTTIVTHASRIVLQLYSEADFSANEATFREQWSLIPSHSQRFALVDSASIITLLGPVAERTDAFGSLLTIANQAYLKFVSVSDSQEAVIGVVSLLRKRAKRSNNASIERVEGHGDSSEHS
jgi:hypothetical protein